MARRATATTKSKTTKPAAKSAPKSAAKSETGSKTTGKTAAKSTAKTKSARSSSRSGGTAAPGRPVWSGQLRLALVSVPVQLYPATKTGARISFHQVHEPSGKRIRYEKVVPGIGAVDTDEIVKGFEIDKGRYVLFDEDELDSVKIETKKTLDLIQFVAQGDIDPIWFDRPYYVAPDGDLAEEAYGVLRDALRASRRIGIGQFVMRGREYVAALKPCGNGLMIETLRFADEVRKAAPYFADIDNEEPDQDLLALAGELIERKSGKFDPSQFKDHYTEALKELIEIKKKTGRPLEVDEDEPAGGGAKVIDLVEALKRSVASSGSSPKPSSGGRRKAS
jgi:DNA end-binding protein Ku